TRDYERFSVYFNMDNGSGRFRGIYAQENLAAMPIFEAWLKPFHDVGATTVATRGTGSTDHVSFDRVGLPGFQFIQDRLDYFTNVHHTHLDTWDHVEPEDLKQAAAIVASFAWHAAMREERMPRKPVLSPRWALRPAPAAGPAPGAPGRPRSRATPRAGRPRAAAAATKDARWRARRSRRRAPATGRARPACAGPGPAPRAPRSPRGTARRAAAPRPARPPARAGTPPARRRRRVRGGAACRTA